MGIQSKVRKNLVQYILMIAITRKASAVHESPYVPKLEIGPYHPWPWEGTVPTQKFRTPGRHAAHHPGYQTNIIIDPSGKVRR